MKTIFSAALLVFFGLAIEQCAGATPLSGVIKSVNGQPIPKVKVLTFSKVRQHSWVLA